MSRRAGDEASHREKQSLPLWATIGIAGLVVAGLVWCGQMTLRAAAGPPELRVFMLFSAGAAALVLCYFALMLGGVRVEVRRDVLEIRYGRWPAPVRVGLKDIDECRVVRFQPGRGLGSGRTKPRAYVANGTRGVLLRVKGARPVLIGSDAPDTLASVLRAHGVKTTDAETALDAVLREWKEA